MGGYGATVASFSGNGGIVTNSGGTTSVLTVNQSGNTTYFGLINDGASGKVELVKQGGGMLTISSGGQDTFSGGTTVSGGTLQLNAINALAPGASRPMPASSISTATTSTRPISTSCRPWPAAAASSPTTRLRAARLT